MVEEENNNYIFGKKLGMKMALTSPRFQYEASMMAMFFLMIGMVLMSIYLIGWTGMSLFLKIMTGINTLFGILFMTSYLITTFQQYQSYLIIEQAQNLFKDNITEINKDFNDLHLKGGTENDVKNETLE